VEPGETRCSVCGGEDLAAVAEKEELLAAVAAAEAEQGFARGGMLSPLPWIAALPDCGAPVGSVGGFGRGVTGEPVGWVPCDGRLMDREGYPELYSVLQDSYGEEAAGFRVPDLRGKTGPAPAD
jgi:hypothetical protein